MTNAKSKLDVTLTISKQLWNVWNVTIDGPSLHAEYEGSLDLIQTICDHVSSRCNVTIVTETNHYTKRRS